MATRSMAPFFSAICLTYARTNRLTDAVYCFAQQDYPGPKELVIFNSCPAQQITCNLPNVRVINCEMRPGTLGECRNQAIEAARGTHMVIWDDDDLYLPNHLSNFAENWKDGLHWVWQDRQIYAERLIPKNISQGTYNVFAFTKEAWKGVGGYAQMDCGEDNSICSRISSQFPGKRVEIPGDKISFIYSWGNGVDHISGSAVSQAQDWPGAYKRVAETAARSMKVGAEPHGHITINPVRAPKAIAESIKFLGKMVKIQSSALCIVELGRYGDIINILPICQHIANTFGKPYLMVSREFASILDGVSYVIPAPVDLPYSQLKDAVDLAKSRFKHVLVSQIWGHNWKQDRKTASFNRESWRAAGFLHKFDDRTWSPLFDKRDAAREASVIAKSGLGEGQSILVNVTSGNSSPFAKGAELLAKIHAEFKDVQVIDVSKFRAPYVYDMLGLMEKSTALVSIDTSLLHLAAASTIPVVAIVNNGWQGSELRHDTVARISYEQALKSPALVIHAIHAALKAPRRVVSCQPLVEPPERRIFHAVEIHNETGANAARKARTQVSWKVLYDGGVIPAHYVKYERSALAIGDKRDLPYLKDVLAFAMKQANGPDIIMWTNDDTWLHREIPAVLRIHCSLWGACASHRVDLIRGAALPDSTTPVRDLSHTGQGHMGRDLFAFTKYWLESHWDMIPDFILGASEFDLALAFMIRQSLGLDCQRSSLEFVRWPAELEKGYIVHEAHSAYWARNDNISTAPSQLHNRKLFADWVKQFIPSVRINPDNTLH